LLLLLYVLLLLHVRLKPCWCRCNADFLLDVYWHCCCCCCWLLHLLLLLLW
jgi:hypothetical protein